MDSKKHNHIGDTVRIRRPARVVTDERGRTIWMGEVEPSELRLEPTSAYDPYDTAAESARPASI